MISQARADVEATLLQFIVDELLDEQYEGGDPLVGGLVDSLGIEQLVSYVGERYGVELADADMTVENFESLPALAALIQSKQGRPG